MAVGGLVPSQTSKDPAACADNTAGNHTGFPDIPSAVLALIFIGKRIQPSLSVVDREVELCVSTK